MALPEALFPIELVERTVRRLGPGSAHVPEALTLEQQRRLVAGCRDWSGQAITARGANSRHQVTTLPSWVADLSREVLGRAARTAGSDDSEHDDWAPEGWEPDNALVTYLAPGSGLRMHRVAGGPAPVVVLSIGDACRFRLGNTVSAARPHRDVLLESGDALVYGGAARASFIGVPGIRPGTAPEWCGLAEGRLGIALTTSA